MKSVNRNLCLIGFTILINVYQLSAQKVVYPSVISQPVGFAISGPLRDNPVVSGSDFPAEEIFINREINPNIQAPNYRNLPGDPAEQLQQGRVTNYLLNNTASKTESDTG